MKKVNWGILGNARINQAMIPAMQASPLTDEIYLGSRTLKDSSLPVSDYNGILSNDRVNAIYIPLPNSLHYEWAKNALEAGKHVLVEKPMVTSLSQFDILQNVAKENGVLCMEGFMYQFSPVVSFLKSTIQGNNLGDLSTVSFGFGHPIIRYLGHEDNYRFYRDYGGGAFLDLGVYGVNFLEMLLSISPEIKHVESQRLSQPWDADAQTDIFLNYGSVRARIWSSFIAHGLYLHIAGSVGQIWIDHPISDGSHELRMELNGEVHTETFTQVNLFEREISAFNSAILAGNSAPVTIESSRNTLKVIEQILLEI